MAHPGTIKVGDRFRIPPWKWFPEKTCTVVYIKSDFVVVDIDGEERPDIGELSQTEDWERI
jgi:hypothetical protein